MEKKICSKCKSEKLIECFSWKNKNEGKMHSQCKECQKGPKNDWYARNKESHKARTGKNRDEHKLKVRSFVFNYLLENPCIDCGETNPHVLEFDHVRGIKDKAVSVAIKNGWSMERVKKEIDKCDVRCSNCHKKKTAKDQGWYGDWETLVEEKNKHLVPW